MQNRSTESDVIIVGSGLTGPATALALAQAGQTVTIIDAMPATEQKAREFDGRAYALALASVRLLIAIGIWDRVRNSSQPMLEIRVSDGRAGEGAGWFDLHFDHAEIEEGPMGHMIEDRYLRRAFIDAMEEDDRITVLSGKHVLEQHTDGASATVICDDGTQHRARLLIGSDGRQSGTAMRAGINRQGWAYDQTAIVCAISHELPHNGVAHQFFMPPGPLAILPLPGNQSSIVWSEKAETAKRFLTMSESEFLDALRPRFGSFLGEITLVGKRFNYPLSLSIAESFVAERVALVGDAAHGVHPLAGQGLNAGLRDVAALAQVISEAAKRGEDIAAPDVLERYQTWRRFDTTTLAMTTDLTNRLFSNDNPLLRLGRDLGMGVVNALPALRRGLIREAAGLTGDLPELMR